MRRVLVTGGAGFIGSHTVDLLLAADVQVVVLDNLVSGRVANLDLSHPKLTFIEGDILDHTLVEKALQGCDGVLHLAALPSVSSSIENPLASFNVNMHGFLQVLQAVRASSKKIRLVYASSAAVYGDNKNSACDDETELSSQPLSPYALDKINNERYAHLFKQLFDVDSVGLRYFNVYGAGQDPHSPYAAVISKFIELYQQNETIPVFGDGEQTRDFIHVSDVAKANWLALQGNYCGIVNIATGIPETLKNLVRYIETAGKRPAALTFKTPREGDIRHSCAKTTKALNELGFRYSIKLEQGIHSLLEIGYHKRPIYEE